MQLDRLLTDLYETIGRADPRTADKIATSVLETLPAAMDAVCLKTGYSYTSPRAENSYLPGSFTNFGSPVADHEKVYSIMSPSKPYSLFSFALGAAKTRSNEFKLDTNYLPPHTSYLLHAAEGQHYRTNFLKLFHHRLQPAIRQGTVTVTAFEYLAVRFLHQLASARPQGHSYFRSELTGQSGYRNVYHCLFNEYLAWFRERSESSSGVDSHTLQHNHRFVLCMAEEFLIGSISKLGSGSHRLGMSSAVAWLSADSVLVLSTLLSTAAICCSTRPRSMPRCADLQSIFGPTSTATLLWTPTSRRSSPSTTPSASTCWRTPTARDW